jgi:hypothetical protein
LPLPRPTGELDDFDFEHALNTCVGRPESAGRGELRDGVLDTGPVDLAAGEHRNLA